MKPIIQHRDKNLSIAVFLNTTKEGKEYKSIQLQRSYKKKGQDEWIRETINLFPEDLEPLGQLITDTQMGIAQANSASKMANIGRNSYDPVDNTDIPF